MNNGTNNFTAERIAELRKNIDLSDIPEIKDFSRGHLRNSVSRLQEKNKRSRTGTGKNRVIFSFHNLKSNN